MKEIERERARLSKERAHYTGVVAKLEANGDLEALARARISWPRSTRPG
jgi:hypothetical protein